MNKLKVGYAERCINPPLGVAISGYYKARYGQGFIDNLYAQAIAFEVDGNKSVIIISDSLGIGKELVDRIANEISSKTGDPIGKIMVGATHSHTAPDNRYPEMFPSDEKLINENVEILCKNVCEAGIEALNDVKPAKMGYAVGHAPDRISYIRRYRMKDGTTFTCPPIDSPDIVEPIGELDRRVNVLRFDREGAESIVMLNYGIHADTVNMDMYCSDWVGWTRKTIADTLDGAKCICIMGCQGDVGSTNVHPIPGDMNDTEISFDNEMKSPGMARFVGRALAGTILQVFDKVAYVDVDEMKIISKTLTVSLNVPKEEDMPLARKYKELYDSGREDEIPYKAMQLTTVVAEALRMCRMYGGPTTRDLPMAGIRLGDVGMVFLPGEPFTDIGVKIKETEGYGMIMPCALTNGYFGYFPVKSAFDEGGYEARTSHYVSTIAEEIVECNKEILRQLKK
ncbi:MAG: hypothetical protein J6U92_00355 [Clostridia bacterium]|nr:hypothetical protein [Clostridia bacterium]